jgi:hypothetical protein
MGEATLVAALNAWGAARDREVLTLKINLGATQERVELAFNQAKDALLRIIDDFRGEAATQRNHGQYEAAQSIARLEQVVLEARTKFDQQDVRFADGLNELANRLMAVDAWAQAEPARVAAIVQAAPAPQMGLTSPGGTPLTYFPNGPRHFDGRPAPITPTPQPRPAPLPTAGFHVGGGASAWGPAPALSPTVGFHVGGNANGDPAAQAAAPTLDAWAAYRAAPPLPGTFGDPRHFDMSTPGGGGGKGGHQYPREMRIDQRSWGDHRKLDVGTSFEGFQVWKDRAMMFLSRERPDVRRLLTWAETQSKDSLEADLHAQAGHYGVVDLGAAEFAIHDGIKVIIQDSLLGRARNCVERGCELWRSLCAEWSGAAPQLKQAKARRYQEPARCKDVSELWSRLPAWERLGEEVKLAGLDLPEWLRSAALEKLLPAHLLGILIARPELASYAARVAWVKTQMEHARGLAQATAYGPSAGGTAGDVHMGSLEMAPGNAYSESGEGLVWALHQEKSRNEQIGDWAQAESLQAAIHALAKGKGGFRKGLGKGGPKGAASPGKGGPAPAEGNAEFNGVCHHCGIWGHRRSDCRRLDTEMGKKGGKGGKGGPKGGKGPILECAEENAAEENAAAEDLAGEEWYFGHLGSVTPAEPEWTPAKATKATAYRKPALLPTAGFHVGGSAAPARTEHKNRFSALSLLLDDAAPEELLGAVAGDERRGRIVEAVVDSGAVHSVAPPSKFPGPMTSSPWSRAGRGYRAANGTGIKNLGQVQVAFGTNEGHKCKIPFQVANVEQALLSVAHLTMAGNRVELGANDGRIVNISTGRTIALEKRGGVYLLKMFVADDGTPLPFGRQGA